MQLFPINMEDENVKKYTLKRVITALFTLLAILLVQAGGILLYLLCMPPLYWVCAQADFSHFYGILDFWRQDSAILLVPVYDSIFLTAGFCLIRWIVEEVRRRKR